MTIKDLFYRSTNIDTETVVQLFKSKEGSKYYSDDLFNLSFEPIPLKDIRNSSAEIEHFWFHEFNEDGFATLVFILLEGDTL